jgi:hypothetical protein
VENCHRRKLNSRRACHAWPAMQSAAGHGEERTPGSVRAHQRRLREVHRGRTSPIADQSRMGMTMAKKKGAGLLAGSRRGSSPQKAVRQSKAVTTCARSHANNCAGIPCAPAAAQLLRGPKKFAIDRGRSEEPPQRGNHSANHRLVLPGPLRREVRAEVTGFATTLASMSSRTGSCPGS